MCMDHLLGCSTHIMSPIHYKAPCPTQWGASQMNVQWPCPGGSWWGREEGQNQIQILSCKKERAAFPRDGFIIEADFPVALL